MAGTYTVGKSSAANFQTISAALIAVQQNGAAGPVTFIVDKEVYNQQEIIAAIVKTPISNNVEFVSSADQSNTADVADDATAVATK